MAGRARFGWPAAAIGTVAATVGVLAPATTAGAAVISGSVDHVPDLQIADNSTVSSTINVVGSGLVDDLVVVVDIDHARVGHVSISLVHNGTTVVLLDRPGTPPGAHGNSGRLSASFPITFLTGGATAAEDMGDALGGGDNEGVCESDGLCEYAPHQSLAAFDGLPAAGTWELRVTDSRAGHNGFLDGWSLNVTTAALPAPVANADARTTAEDTPIVNGASVLDNDTTTPPGGTLSASLVTGTSNGSVTLDPDGTFDYTPNADFNGTDSFTYTATDANGTVSAPATVTITVTPVNDVPVAVDDGWSVLEDTTLTVPAVGVLANDTDADGDPLTAGILTLPGNGSVTLTADGAFVYVPDPDFSGTDTFTYTAADAGTVSAPATVTITVTPVNDQPTAVDDSATTPEDTPLTVVAPGVLGNDLDADSGSLTAGSASDPANGSVTLNADGSYTYTPDAGFNGVDTFTYSASDGSLDDQATVTITVGPVNDAPNAVSDAASTDEDMPVSVPAPGVLANDSDPEGDTLLAGSASDPANGSVTLNADGSYTYTPDQDFEGVDSFTYTATDPGGLTDTATVTITVAPVNDRPVAASDVGSTSENTPLPIPAAGVLANDTDADGDTLAAGSASDPDNGSVTLNADGSYTYTPDAGFSGVDSFTYVASDESLSDTATVLISVTAADPVDPVDPGDPVKPVTPVTPTTPTVPVTPVLPAADQPAAPPRPRPTLPATGTELPGLGISGALLLALGTLLRRRGT